MSCLHDNFSHHGISYFFKLCFYLGVYDTWYLFTKVDAIKGSFKKYYFKYIYIYIYTYIYINFFIFYKVKIKLIIK